MTRRKRHGERFTNPNIQRPGVLYVVKSYILQKINAFCERIFGPTLWFFLSKFVQVFWAVLAISIPLTLMGWETWNRRMQTEDSPCFDINRDFTTQAVARKRECGTRIFKFFPQKETIPGRENAQFGEFPWMARLVIFVDGNLTECAGSIIHEQYILTVASCFYNLKKEGLEYDEVNAYVGEKATTSGRTRNPEYEDMYVAENVIIHPKFDSANIINNICLVKLETKIKLSGVLYPICLPIFCDMQLGRYHSFTSNLTAAAWGASGPGRHAPEKFLQKMPVTPKYLDECKSPHLTKQLANDTVKCSSSVVGQSVCQGDAGGPLMCDSQLSGRTRTYIVGLISDGDLCLIQNQQTKTYFTMVAPYLRWIFDTIAESH